MKRNIVRFNIFAPDAEDIAFNLSPDNGPDDAQRLIDQIEGFGRGLKVVTIAVAHRGSFDICVEGATADLEWLVAELGAEDAEWCGLEPHRRG